MVPVMSFSYFASKSSILVFLFDLNHPCSNFPVFICPHVPSCNFFQLLLLAAMLDSSFRMESHFGFTTLWCYNNAGGNFKYILKIWLQVLIPSIYIALPVLEFYFINGFAGFEAMSMFMKKFGNCHCIFSLPFNTYGQSF